VAELGDIYVACTKVTTEVASFIHSFWKIYISPPQETYSERFNSRNGEKFSFMQFVEQ